MAIFHKFLSCIPSSKYIFRNGKAANFVAGQYVTDIQTEIDELNAEVEARHPHITVNKEELTVSSDKIDPLAGLKAKWLAEHLASQQAAVNPANDRGSYDAIKNAGMTTTAGTIAVTSNTTTSAKK